MHRPNLSSAFQNSITRLLRVTIKSTFAVFVSVGSASVPLASNLAFDDMIKINLKTAIFIIMFASLSMVAVMPYHQLTWSVRSISANTSTSSGFHFPYCREYEIRKTHILNHINWLIYHVPCSLPGNLRLRQAVPSMQHPVQSHHAAWRFYLPSYN